VLILGRFTTEYTPMMFDFEKVESRDFTETIKFLAGMSRFVIVDLTSPKSSPLELQATVPDYMIPFVPIIEEGENPFSMFNDLWIKYKWMLPPLRYPNKDTLLEKFQKGIIDRAIEKEKELLIEKAKKMDILDL